MSQVVVSLISELIFSTKVSAIATEAGLSYCSGRGAKFAEILSGTQPALVVVELEDPKMLERLGQLLAKWPKLRTLGFASHTREELFATAEAMGVTATTKGQFDRALAAEIGSILSHPPEPAS